MFTLKQVIAKTTENSCCIETLWTLTANILLYTFICTAIHSFVTGEPTDFKFGTLTYHGKSHPADEKSSLKGMCSGSGDPF